MRHAERDLADLQAVLDQSHANAGAHLTGIFNQGSRITAHQLANELTGILEIALGVLAGDGSPLVAPIDAIFAKGKVWFSLAAQSLRAKLLPRDPRVSATYTAGPTFIVHGTARVFDESDPDFEEVDALVAELYVAQYGEQWYAWRDAARERGPGYSAWIEPRVMFAKH